MSLSLFDLVGPVMVGPSSSHTAGAVRIGYMARQILGAEPERITLHFNPVLMQTYAGHRTHAALVAGLLGYREGDSRVMNALSDAKKKGISVGIQEIPHSENVHPNTMRVTAESAGHTMVINGISVGGGSILLSAIDGVPVDFDGNTYILLLRAPSAPPESMAAMLQPYGVRDTFAGPIPGGFLACWSLQQPVPAAILDSIKESVSGATARLIPPLYHFRQTTSDQPYFTTFAELIDQTRGKSLPEVALAYENLRSGADYIDILENMREILAVMRDAADRGLTGHAELIGGFCPGNDGWRLLQAYESGKSITGGIFALAQARALAVMEVNGALGRVVAAPTAGSAGVLPGVVLSVGEKLGKNDDDLVNALLVAAAVGVCVANRASLSGAVGGCQGEIGVAATMAATAAAYLAGGNAETCAQAASLTLKNILGLICDPAAGPVEVPCIKRNALGVAAALMGAELALAGIKSYIPPDEVVDALVNVQKLLPQELKGATIGGLGCTRTAAAMKVAWQEKLKKLEH